VAFDTIMGFISEASQRLQLLPLFVGCLLSLLFLIITRKKPWRGLSLPPGPKGLPIVKNLFDLPSERQWECAADWSKNYGDIIHIDIAGMHVVYLNSFHDVTNLMEKRSSIYSDRMHTPMLKLMDIGDILSMARYGDAWRLKRRIFHQEFNSTTSHKFMDTQLQYVRSMLDSIKKDPTRFENHLKFFTAGTILKSIYGFEIKSADDPYIRIANEGVSSMEGIMPGRFLVDAFPFMLHLPDWLPGTSFKHKARLWGKQMMDSCRIPFENITKSFLEGTASPSFTTSWLSKISNILEEEERKKLSYVIQVTAGTAFLAGQEAIAYTLHNFVFFMLKHAEIQDKAQAELDRVVGRGRLPDFEDKESLPYINALYKEVLRIHPIAPLIPRSVTIDDEYKGMLIPKGSAIMANTWAMSRNMEDYGPDPDVFRPERFLEKELRHPAQFVFGFGRRICPGRFMSENSVFIAICSILQVFKIDNAVNEDGSKIHVEPYWIPSMVTHLASFPASFELRFNGAEKLIDTD